MRREARLSPRQRAFLSRPHRFPKAHQIHVDQGHEDRAGEGSGGNSRLKRLKGLAAFVLGALVFFAAVAFLFLLVTPPNASPLGDPIGYPKGYAPR